MIAAKTTPGAGSTFRVYLPAAASKARLADGAAVPASSPQRPVKILVMDDEAAVRHLSRELLRALGHGVEVALHGQEALDKYREATATGTPFDIVILDLTVRGGMGGAETVKKLREMDPAVKAIVSSGYSDDAALADQMKHGFQACLEKPYGINELRAMVNALSV